MIAVGVDVGGTATRAVCARDGVPRGEATGPGSNATTAGSIATARTIVDTIRAAAGFDEPGAIVVGAAGAGRAAVAQAIAGALADVFPRARIQVGDDAPIALRAAIPAGPGIVLIAGTGSVAYAESDVRTVRVGGAGYLLGDEGSAFAIGMAAVRLYSRVLDGRAARDETTDLVARALDAPDRDGLLSSIYGAPLAPARIAALAPSIIAFAGKGNRASTKIVQQAAQDLGELVRAVARAAELVDRAPAIALSGGLFSENSLLSFLLETRINGDIPAATIVRGGEAPVFGAVHLAQALLEEADGKRSGSAHRRA